MMNHYNTMTILNIDPSNVNALNGKSCLKESERYNEFTIL